MANSDIIIGMRQIQKLAKNPVIWLAFFSLLYFALRLTNLTALPIFTDEAIYIRWSQIGAQDASWRYISLTDGKQPLFTWFVMAALRIFHDPLFAGRFVSVIAGFAGMIGMYFLGFEVFKSKRVGIISSFLYLISPFTLMYDRMALYDAMVAAFSIWNLYLAVLLVRLVRLDVALIFGLSLGVGMLNKTSAFLSLYLLPVTIALFDWTNKKERSKRLTTWIIYCVLAAFLSQAIYSILRLSPYFYIVSQKDTLFVYPYSEWITHPFRFLQGNLHGEFDWLIHYMTVPLFIAAFFPFLIINKKILEKLVLLLWWFAPFFALALFGKVLYPRFILFMAMPMYVLAAYSFAWILEKVKSYKISYVIIGAFCLPSILISYSVIFHIKDAAIPKSDVGQYINDWPSGWGTSEVVSYLKDQSARGPIAVYTEGTFGLFPYALEIYLVNDKNIEIHGLWPPSKTMPEEMGVSAKIKPTFFVANQTQEKPDWPLVLISKYKKANNSSQYMHLYKVELPVGK